VKRQRGKHHIRVVSRLKRTVDGIVFKSGTEARRYVELKIRAQGGLISHLEPHPVVRNLGGEDIKWDLDFKYVEPYGLIYRIIYEDHKAGVLTEKVKLLMKLWKYHGPAVLRITEYSGRHCKILHEITPEDGGWEEPIDLPDFSPDHR